MKIYEKLNKTDILYKTLMKDYKGGNLLPNNILISLSYIIKYPHWWKFWAKEKYQMDVEIFDKEILIRKWVSSDYQNIQCFFEDNEKVILIVEEMDFIINLFIRMARLEEYKEFAELEEEYAKNSFKIHNLSIMLTGNVFKESINSDNDIFLEGMHFSVTDTTLRIIDKINSSIIISETDYSIHVNYLQALNALLYSWNFPLDCLDNETLDLRFEIDGIKYNLYFRDILVRTYDPSESIYNINCYFEEVDLRCIDRSYAKILITYAGYKN